MAALIREPQDRAEAVRPAIEALGGKLVAAGYPMGEYDAIVLFEAPDDTSAAAFALAIAAGGAAKSAKTTRLLSGQEWIESFAQGARVSVPAATVATRAFMGSICRARYRAAATAIRMWQSAATRTQTSEQARPDHPLFRWSGVMSGCSPPVPVAGKLGGC